MHALFDRLIPWGAGIIVAVQSVSTDALDWFFTAVTCLGQPPFYLLLLAAVFWCVDKRHGLRLTVLLLVTVYVNELLKGTYVVPRPFLVHPEIEAKIVPTGYSFPSGHAQSSAAIWPALAHHVRRRPFTALAVVLIVLVSFSRIYLGVHYPHDAIAGIVVGLALFLGYLGLGRAARTWVAPRHYLPILLLGMAMPAMLLAVYVDQELRVVAGALLGASAGFLAEEQAIDYAPRRGAALCLARMAIGLPFVGLATLALVAPLLYARLGPFGQAAHALLSAAVGFAVSFGLPWFFTRIGLALRDEPGEPRP